MEDLRLYLKYIIQAHDVRDVNRKQFRLKDFQNAKTADEYLKLLFN